MNGKFKSCKLGFVTLLVVAFFVLSATAYAQAAAALPSCSNGVQDGNETGVDCGGKCVVQYVLEVCDGRDNDKDCLVDEDCKTNAGGISTPVSPIPAKPAPQTTQQPATEHPVTIPATPNTMPEVAPMPEPVSAPAPVRLTISEPSQVPATPAPSTVRQPSSAPVPELGSQPDNVASTPAKEAPAEQAVEVGDFSKLNDDQIAEQTSQIRQFAKKSGAYIPESEPDSELLKKYVAFAKKHEAEFEAKFQGKELTEKDIADVLKQFSEEAYPKPVVVQQQSFFSKVAGFFKRIFG